MSVARMPAMIAPSSCCSAGLPLPRVPRPCSGFSSTVVSLVLLCSTSASSGSSDPTRAISTCVDVNERSVPGPSRIDPCPANKLRMSGLDPIDSCLDDLAIIDADPVILIEIIHETVVIAVDEDVRRVAIHMTAECGASLGITARRVVLRRPESAHDVYAADVDAMRR